MLVHPRHVIQRVVNPRSLGQMTSYKLHSSGGGGKWRWRKARSGRPLIDPSRYTVQPAVYGKLIYTVIYMSDRPLTQANPDIHLPLPTRTA